MSQFQRPKGWQAAGSHPQNYEMGIDPAITYGDKACATIKANESPGASFGTLMQSIAATNYRNTRLRLSGVVKATGVDEWAGLWMRVDGPQQQGLAFDNMQGRRITGTCDWAGHAVVLDVAAEAEVIAFGILLSGPGQVWLADVQLETVGPEVPTTDQTRPPLPEQPVNLSFSA